MKALEVSWTSRKREKITGRKVSAVESVKNHFHNMRGQEILNTLRYVRGARYCDATSIDHYDNVVAYVGYAA